MTQPHTAAHAPADVPLYALPCHVRTGLRRYLWAPAAAARRPWAPAQAGSVLCAPQRLGADADAASCAVREKGSVSKAADIYIG